MISTSLINDRLKIYDDLYIEIVTTWEKDYPLGSNMKMASTDVLTSKIYLRATSTKVYTNLDLQLSTTAFSVNEHVDALAANSAILIYETSQTTATENPFYYAASQSSGKFNFTVIDNTNNTKTVYYSWGGYSQMGNTTLGSISETHNFTDAENLTVKHTVESSDSNNTVGIFNPNNDEYLFSKTYSSTGNKTTTFAFTDAQRDTLRKTYNTAVVNKVRIGIRNTSGYTYVTGAIYKPKTATSKTSSTPTYTTRYFLNYIEKEFTVLDCTPLLDPTVKDIKPETLALTGNEDVIVKYESMAEFSTGAVAVKGAEIVSQSVQCGSKTVTDMEFGIIDDAESATFTFNATDSRGVRANTIIVHKSVVNYVKPTCHQDFEVRLSGKTSAEITLKVSGNYYHGSFGLTDNTLLLEMRYGKKGEELSEWTTIENTPTFRDNQYEVFLTFDGFHYEDSYIFQSRITDKLNFVQSSQYTVKMLPVFDWSESDFNFNVPVMMNGETVLRHNEEANNTVLSASGGHIYLRPAGTDETTGETIIYPDGSIKFGGSVDFGENAEINSAITFNNTTSFNYSLTIGDHILNDFVIETGSEAMGTNGTWYWQKWASGKAECWGSRNFGNMAVTTKWGTLYRSEALTQDLPSGLFAATPAVININMNNSSFGGWICRYEETAPDETNTGSFIYVRPASATATPTHIGFHVIGRWQ